MLHEIFSDSQRAAAYLASGLCRHFPKRDLDLTLFLGADGPTRHMSASTEHIEPIIERFARRFPGHQYEVIYDVDREDGVVGVVRCHCTKEHLTWCRCRLQRKSNSEKPQAVVRVPAQRPSNAPAPSESGTSAT